MKERTIIETRTENPLAILFYVLAVVAYIATLIILIGTKENLFVLLFFAVPVIAGIGAVLQNGVYYLKITNVRITAQYKLFGKDGKRVELPVTMITAIGRGILRRISVATAHGNITLFFVVNHAKVYSAVADLLTLDGSETYAGTAEEMQNERLQRTNNKNGKKRIRIISIVAAVIIIFLILIVPFAKYRSAIKNYEQGNYEKARVMFMELKHYRNSEAWLDECEQQIRSQWR